MKIEKKTEDIIDSGYNKQIKSVWELKERAFDETKNLSIRESLDFIHNKVKNLNVMKRKLLTSENK
jgi:hypothetical protein